MKVSFAKNKNIPTNGIDNNSAGKGDIGALEDAVIIPKLDTNIKQGQFKSWIKELDAEIKAEKESGDGEEDAFI